MKRLFMALVILYSCGLCAQWQAMGVTSGLINCMIADPTQSIIMIATDSGVYYAPSTDLSTWTALSGGLRDFNVIKMIWTPGPPACSPCSTYAVLTPSGVAATTSKIFSNGRPWVIADSAGLMDSSGNMGYQGSQAIGFYVASSTLYVYLAIKSGETTTDGIYYRSLTIDGTGIPTWDPTGWHKDASYTYSTSVFSMATVNQAGTLVVAAQGGIYSKTGGSWAPASGTSSSNTYQFLSGDPLASGNSAQVITGFFNQTTSQYSIGISGNAGGSFSNLCGASAPTFALPFTDLFMNGAYGAGTNGLNVFKIDPAACPNPVSPYSNFLGSARAVLTKDAASVLVGTAGNGLWYFPDSTSPGIPVGNSGQVGVTSAILNQNVTDITQAVVAGSDPTNAPPVLFTASTTSGLYKCFKPTYCTRYFFAPDRIDGVAGTSVALVPGYDEFGVVAYSNGGIASSTLQNGGSGYAVGDTGAVSGCGNGQATYVVDSVISGAVAAYHIMDPGQSYTTATCTTTRGGMQPGNGTGFTITITSVAYSMNVGVKTLFLGTRDFGIHRSDNGGASWKKLINFPHPGNDTTKEYEIVKVLVAPDFNPGSATHTDQHVFVVTRDGWLFFSADGGETWSTESGAISAATKALGGTGYAFGDTGTVSGCGNGQASYFIDSVISGQVTSFHIVDPGQGYDTSHNPCPTLKGGSKPGAGSGFAINITDVTGGDTSPALPFVVTNDAAISPGYQYNSPDGPTSTRILFMANSNALVKVRIRSLSPLAYSIVPVFQAPIGTHFLPMLSVAIAPCFDSTAAQCTSADAREKSFVLVGTDGQGIYYSPANGDAGTFTPNPVVFTAASDPNCAGSSTASIPELTLHPKSGASTNCANAGDTKCLLTYFVKHKFTSAAASDHGLYYMRFVPGVPAKWECQNADPAPGCHPEFSDYMVPVVTFSPIFDGTANKDVYAGHVNAGMWHAQHPPTSTDCTPGYRAWDPLKGFSNIPERINSLAECPDYAIPTADHNANRIVLAGTSDMGTMISFNSGKSYYPWGLGLEDPGGHTLHDVFAVSCSDRYDPCGGTCPQHRVLASAAGCTSYDLSTGNLFCRTSPDSETYYGIYWGNLPPSQYGTTRWNQALYESGPFSFHQVPEIRYCSMTVPVMASDVGHGSLYSLFTAPDNFGQNWHVDSDPNAPTTLSDITCPGGQSGPTFAGTAGRALPGPRGSRGSYIWGAQSGGAVHFRAAGGVKYKNGGSWTSCTGLDPDADWRSILMLDSTESVLVGSQGTSSIGIYHNAQPGGTCTQWASANMGFASGDSPQITQTYSKKILGFAKVANGVLAALDESCPSCDDGGVFFSDTGSDGEAWVPVNSGMNCSSNYEVYNGSSIYTGSTCSGVYSTDTITYTGYPTAYADWANSGDPWAETKVTFTDRSAGLPDSRAWDFDNNGLPDSTASPADWVFPELPFGYTTYSSAKLTSAQGSSSDTYQPSDDGRVVEIVNTRISKVEKIGSDLKFTWDKASGGGHTYAYAMYRDTSTPAGSGKAAVSACTPSCLTDCTCTYTETNQTAYYKIQTTW